MRSLPASGSRRWSASRPGAAEERQIDAFLTLPPDAASGNRLPTILRIHGGPVSQYSTSFELEWQVLAAAGYAVVAANPRGSSGYGRDFSRAIWADWGNKDFDDVMAAVDAAIAKGVADPERLGVGGWSYGGILTNYVITKTDRFKAAISGASEVELPLQLRDGPLPEGVGGRTRAAVARTAERLDQAVALLQRRARATPTLILCGQDDMNVPLLNSEQLYQALRRLGKTTELVDLSGAEPRHQPSELRQGPLRAVSRLVRSVPESRRNDLAGKVAPLLLRSPAQEDERGNQRTGAR